MKSEEFAIEETGREGPVRHFSVCILAAVVQERVAAQLATRGKSLRLPGFRPGNIPTDVLEKRYGAQMRGEVLTALSAEIIRGLPEGGMLASLTVVDGAVVGDVRFTATATYLEDLPTLDFSALIIERLVLDNWDEDEEARETARCFERQQILDYLADAHTFPVAAGLVERECAALERAAQAQVSDTESDDWRDMIAGVRTIAERRIRLGMVVAEIARRQQLRVSDAEMERERQAAQTSAPSEAPAEMRARLLEEKVIGWILSQAQIIQRRITREDLLDVEVTPRSMPSSKLLWEESSAHTGASAPGIPQSGQAARYGRRKS